jgi:hypothetical protein
MPRRNSFAGNTLAANDARQKRPDLKLYLLQDHQTDDSGREDGRITRAGAPTATEPAGMSRVTTLFAPITAPSPIDIPRQIITPRPIHTFSPIVIGEIRNPSSRTD